MLRKGLAGGVESGESSLEEAVRPTPDHPLKRFEHYELVTGEDGKPIELGRGAMGVTYKAFDADLRCPVALMGNFAWVIAMVSTAHWEWHADPCDTAGRDPLGVICKEAGERRCLFPLVGLTWLGSV